MLHQIKTMNILSILQRNCSLNSYFEIVKNYKSCLNVYASFNVRLISWSHTVATKSEVEPCRNFYYKLATRRNGSLYSLSCNHSVLHKQWTVISCNGIMTKVPIGQNSNPQLQVRHISGQAGEVTQGLWVRMFLWLSESTPVSYAQDLLLFIHSSTGLSWWATIILTTVFLRSFVTFPLAIYQNYILAKVENLRLIEMPEIVKELKRETAIAIKKFNWSEKQARIAYNRSLSKQWNNLIIRDNCHPFKASVLLWAQIPMWVFLSVALRNLVYMLPHRDGAAMITYLEMSVGGVGWIPNLLVPDESLILPVALGLINLAIVELQTMSKIRKDTKLQKYVINIFRVLSLVMIPIAASVPSCLSLYWVTSSTYGLVQNLALLSPRLRKFSHIPETPSQLENPYRHIASEIRHRAAYMSNWWKPKVG